MSQPSGNMLILMSDEHQARALGCAGHPDLAGLIRTPHLDALARRGMRFANAVTPSPICVPARASFATGRPVHRTRLWDNAMPYAGQIPGWGHALQAKGVRVESIGKLHYRAEEDPAGFDTEHIPMMVAGGVGMVWASIRREAERVSRPGRMLGPYIGPGESTYTAYDAAVTARAVQWLGDAPTGPWCLYVGLVAPHFPLVCPQAYFDLYPAETLPAPKQHPRDGHARHPWVERQNAFMDSEAKFRDRDERLAALSAYYGLCSWLDHNVGQILNALEETGLAGNTTVIYTSDHGDNAGARGLWGKSNLYRESVDVPLIMAGPGIDTGICATPVSLIDLSQTIARHFGTEIEAPGTDDLRALATAPPNPERPVFSEYHAAGAVSGAFMLRRGRWKYHHYIGFPPELFDLREDPEERRDLAGDPGYHAVLAEMEAALRDIVDPDAADAQAFADQAALIERVGGRDAALNLGASAATPPPKVSS
ncbi:MAG: sulfatase-like hydrolase/transferase [Pseudomonadota bacterium]